MADGEVEITLCGKAHTLVCTARAFKTVGGMGGGFGGVFQRLAQFDPEAYEAIIAAGLNKRPSDVSELVYKTGMRELTGPLSEFVSQLMNGGKPVKADEPETEENN